MNKIYNCIILLLVLFSYVIGKDINTFKKIIAIDEADNTYFSNMIEAIDGGYLICGYWEKYDLSSINIEANYESEIALIKEKYNNKENFTDCNDTKSICEGDDNWDENLGNRKWDSGEIFEDINNNGKYDGLSQYELEKLSEYWFYGGNKDKRNANKEHLRKIYVKKIDYDGKLIWENTYDFMGGFPYIVKGFDNYIISNKFWQFDAMKNVRWPTYDGSYYLIDIKGEILGNYKQNPSNINGVEWQTESLGSASMTHPVFSHNGNLVNAIYAFSYDKLFDLLYSSINGEVKYKTDKHLDYPWDKTYDDIKAIYDIINTYDGGYLITGFYKHNTFDIYARSQPDFDPWIIKTNMHGTVENKVFSSRGSGDEQNLIIYQTEDGGVLTGGWTGKKTWKSFIKKYNANLKEDPIWGNLKKFEDTQILGLSNAIDNGYIVTGRINIGQDGNFAKSGYIEFQKVLLMHLSLRGRIDWYNWFSSPNINSNNQHITSQDSGENIFITDDGGYLIAGQTVWTDKIEINVPLKNGKTRQEVKEIEQTKVLLIKTDSSGKIAY